jgi:hypothetical protein
MWAVVGILASSGEPMRWAEFVSRASVVREGRRRMYFIVFE